MNSVTEENVRKLLNEKDNKTVELNTLKSTTETAMWIRELEELKTCYCKYKDQCEQMMNDNPSHKKKVKKLKVHA